MQYFKYLFVSYLSFTECLYLLTLFIHLSGLPCGSEGKVSGCNVGDPDPFIHCSVSTFGNHLLCICEFGFFVCV